MSDDSDEKRVSSGDPFKVGPTGFTNGLNMGVRREWSLSKVTKVFGLNNWQDQMRQGKMVRGRGLGRKGKSLVLDSSSLRCQL